MSLFFRRYAESSRTSKRAFWVTIVSALVSLTLIPFQNETQSHTLEQISSWLTAAMLAGLGILGISLHRDRRATRP